MRGMATRVRTMPALFLAPGLVAGAIWYASLVHPADAYPVSATALGTAGLAFIVPFAAATAAWEGSRLRRGGFWHGPWVRPHAEILADRLWPAVVVSIVAVLAGVEASVLESGGGLPDGRPIGVAALDIVAFAAAGAATGLLLPFAIAGPLAIVVPLFWLAFVPAMDPVWLRHITGMFRDCCAATEDLSIRPIVASSLVDLGILAATAFAISNVTEIRRGIAMGASLVVAGSVATALVAGMSYAPTSNRSLADLTCARASAATICVWPEHQADLIPMVRVLPTVLARWSDAGIPAPDLFTEAESSAAPAGSAILVLSGGGALGDDGIIEALSSSLLPTYPNCLNGGSTGWQVAEYLQAWYEAAAGMPDASLAARHEQPFDPSYPPVMDVVQKLSRATLDSRLAWTTRVTGITQACGDWAVDQLQVR